MLAGTLTLKRPGRIRFQYQPGVPLLIVGDGKALTMIDYQVRQVSRWPVGDSPLGLLLDPSKDISRFAHVVATGSSDAVLIEGRDPKHPEFGTISVGFTRDTSAPGGLSLKGWTVLDAQGNRSTHHAHRPAFQRARRRPPVPAGAIPVRRVRAADNS